MTRPTLLVALLAIACPFANASSFGGTSAGASSAGSSGTSGSTSGDDKVVMLARDDAAIFVASDGRIRGAQLEAALRHQREHHAELQQSTDMQLALAILAQ